MPWLSIVVWIISFLAAGGTKSGQAGKAALIATGAAAATYYLADPANPNAVFDIFENDAAKTEVATQAATSLPTGANSTSSLGSVLDTTVKTAGGVLTSWGPTGTVGVIAGTAAATGSGIFKDVPPWVLWVGGGLIAWKLLS